MAGHRRRAGRARRRADRVRQDAGRVPVVPRPARHRTGRRRSRCNAAGSSTSPRSRPSRSTSSATCAARSPASGRPPQRLGIALPDVPVAIRTGDTPADERRQFARQAARHPHHHARVALPAPHRAVPRGPARRRDGHRRRGPRRRRHQARRPPRASLERLDALLERPARRIGLSATVRPARRGRPVPRRAPATSWSSSRPRPRPSSSRSSSRSRTCPSSVRRPTR